MRHTWSLVLAVALLSLSSAIAGAWPRIGGYTPGWPDPVLANGWQGRTSPNTMTLGDSSANARFLVADSQNSDISLKVNADGSSKNIIGFWTGDGLGTNAMRASVDSDGLHATNLLLSGTCTGCSTDPATNNTWAPSAGTANIDAATTKVGTGAGAAVIGAATGNSSIGLEYLNTNNELLFNSSNQFSITVNASMRANFNSSYTNQWYLAAPTNVGGAVIFRGNTGSATNLDWIGEQTGGGVTINAAGSLKTIKLQNAGTDELVCGSLGCDGGANGLGWTSTHLTDVDAGVVTLSAGSGTATLNGSSTRCVCTDNTDTAGASVSCTISAGTLTAHGTGSDTIAYFCWR